MRNLKKVLSLALAMVMLLGMMVIGAGAVETSFADNDKVGETYKEAVAVMTEVGVINGKENNNFDPEGTLTRAEAATILVRVTMGTEAAKGLAGVTKSGVFTDMSNHWAAGYVDACFNKGIVGGIGNSLYAPDSKLTGTQFAAMLMRAAGVEGDFTGSSWESAVIAAAAKAKLSEVTTGEISRQAAAKMAFDGILYSPSGEKAYKVGNLTFDNFLEAYIANGSKTDGIEVSTASDSLAKSVLGLTETTKEDAFGNPQKVWQVDGKDKVTVPGVKSDKVFTAPFTANDLKDYKCNDDMVVMVDGKETTAVDEIAEIVGLGGNGVEVSIYASNKNISKVVVVNPYVGTVSRVTEAKGDAKRSVTVSPSGLKFETEDFAKDDVVIYTKADDKIQAMYQPNLIEGIAVTRKTGTTSFVADGETYKYTALGTGSVANPSVNNVIDVYLDQYGFAAKVEINKGYSNYAYVLDSRTGNYSTTYYAKLVMTDGTVVEDAQVDSNASSFKGKIVTFTKNAKDVYTLTGASNASQGSGSIVIEHGKPSMTLSTAVNANSKTIFLIQSNASGVWTAYTGYADVPNITTTGSFAMVASASRATIVVVPNAPVSSGVNLFVLKTANPDFVSDEDGDYYVYPAVVDGEITTVKLDNVIASSTLFNAVAYANEDAAIIDISECRLNGITTRDGVVNTIFEDGLIEIKGVNRAVSADVEVYKLGTTNITASSIEEINAGDTVNVAVEKDGELISVFYTEKTNTTPGTPTTPGEGAVATKVVAVLAEATPGDDGVVPASVRFLVSGANAEDLTTTVKRQAVKEAYMAKEKLTDGTGIIVNYAIDSISGLYAYTISDGGATAGTYFEFLDESVAMPGTPDRDYAINNIGDGWNDEDDAANYQYGQLVDSGYVSFGTTFTPSVSQDEGGSPIPAVTVSNITWHTNMDVKVPAFFYNPGTDDAGQTIKDAYLSNGKLKGHGETSDPTINAFAIVPFAYTATGDDGETEEVLFLIVFRGTNNKVYDINAQEMSGAGVTSSAFGGSMKVIFK